MLVESHHNFAASMYPTGAEHQQPMASKLKMRIQALTVCCTHRIGVSHQHLWEPIHAKVKYQYVKSHNTPHKLVVASPTKECLYLSKHEFNNYETSTVIFFLVHSDAPGIVGVIARSYLLSRWVYEKSSHVNAACVAASTNDTKAVML